MTVTRKEKRKRSQKMRRKMTRKMTKMTLSGQQNSSRWPSSTSLNSYKCSTANR